MSAPTHPTFDDVVQAAARIAGIANRTPVLTSRSVDAALGARVWFKCENMQRTGAFKFRGAYNALARFTPAQRAAGVAAYSSGNHAQAIALAARLLDMPATIVMPQDAPAAKVAATRGYGGQVVLYDRYREDREQIGRDLAARHGLTLIPPYDHPDLIAGQGTVAQELFDEAGPLDYLFAPLGGGGLLSGCALAARALSPGCQVIGVEPEAGNDGQQSFRTGRIVHIATPPTIADGAQTQHLGDLTFPIIRRDVADVLTASDEELVEAMRFLAGRMKLVVEPTGCLGFAAARRMGSALAGKRVGIVLSGGNVDLARFSAWLSG
jgi:threonine dehydratase